VRVGWGDVDVEPSGGGMVGRMGIVRTPQAARMKAVQMSRGFDARMMGSAAIIVRCGKNAQGFLVIEEALRCA
jgi:hypothetical protein